MVSFIFQFFSIDPSACIQLFLRVIELDVGKLEKDVNDGERKSQLKVVSDRFLRLSQLFPVCHGIKRQCIMKAFNLNPTGNQLNHVLKLNGYDAHLTFLREDAWDHEFVQVKFFYRFG